MRNLLNRKKDFKVVIYFLDGSIVTSTYMDCTKKRIKEIIEEEKNFGGKPCIHYTVFGNEGMAVWR